MVRAVANEMDVDIDQLITSDPIRPGVHVKLVKRVGGEQYFVEASFDPCTNISDSVVCQELEQAIRELREQYRDTYEFDEHYLVFESRDGEFYAEDTLTGKEWEVDASVHPEFVEETEIRVQGVWNPDIPDHLIQYMKMYVIGWALETDRSEALNDMAVAEYQYGDDSPTTERFKYHPAQ